MGSFAATAQELDTTAASVSYHVRRLEAQTGMQLFRRHAQRVELTAAGELVAAEATRAFALLRASFAKERPSRSMPSTSSATTSALTGPDVSLQISRRMSS